MANLPAALYLVTVGVLALVVLQVLNLAYTVDQAKTARRLLEMEQTLTRQHAAATPALETAEEEEAA